MKPPTPPSISSHPLAAERHGHVFDPGNPVAERSTRIVLVVTALTMVLEILAGQWFNSMALLADGWHMSTHALAIGLSALAYRLARRHAHDRRYAFGTWKIEVLAGFSSAIVLLGVATMMVSGSVERLLAPRPIQFADALIVACVGLVINIACALILGHAHHQHDHDHEGISHGAEADHSHHHDLNLRSAYLHVIADAATSVLAIGALAGGMIWGWNWLDPAMGIVGALWISIWAVGLLRETAAVLLDREMDHPIVTSIEHELAHRLQVSGGEIADLHVWRVGRAHYAVILSLSTRDDTLEPHQVKAWLSALPSLAHISVEINLAGDSP